ncbi:MAG: molybdopterin guanine dinucleotide synthesis B family protein, partial [Pseudomonadota bacterium]
MPEILDQQRLSRIKRAFTTRRVPFADVHVLLTQDDLTRYDLRSGDIALASVDRIGHHTKIERCDGRRARLFEGDEIVVALGARYAPDQFEAEIPTTLRACHLAAAGGIAGVVTETHERIIRPTEITLLGLLASQWVEPLNLREFTLAKRTTPIAMPTIGVIGTAMNAGKTTSAAGLIRGLTRAGYRVGAAKVTGTGAGGDYWYYRDAGAARVLDFIDVGYAATYREAPEELEQGVVTLLSELQSAACDIAVVEISDGLAQPETSSLLERPNIRALMPKMVFAARDSA